MKAMVIQLQRCQRERIAHVRKLQQQKYPLPLQQNSNWLGNCATALAHRSIIPRASALRTRALRAPSESDLPSLVCISVMEIACRARTVQSSLARRASVARNLQHVALAAKLQLTRRFWLCCGPVICAKKRENLVRSSFQSSFIQGQKLTGGKWRLTEEQ